MLLRPRARDALLVLAALTLGLIGWGAWWWTHPTLLSGESMGLGSGGIDRKVGDPPLHVAVAGTPWRKPWGEPSPEETITFHGAKAHFTVNDARSRAKFWVCEAREPDSVIGAVDDPLSEHCSELRPLKDGTTMRFGSREYVVMTLTPTKSGKSHVDAVGLDYERTWKHLHQQGTDRVLGELTVIVKP